MSTNPVPLRSVVYAARSSLEHFMIDADERTLCGKRPEHINPSLYDAGRLPRTYHDDYCRRCFERAYAHFDLPTPSRPDGRPM